MVSKSEFTLFSEILSSGLRIVFSKISVLPRAPQLGSRESYEEVLVYHVEVFEPGVLISVGDFVVGPEHFDEFHSCTTQLITRDARPLEWNTLGAGAHTMKVQMTSGAGTGDLIGFHVFVENGNTDSRYDITLVVSEANLKRFAAELKSAGRRT